MNNIKTRLSLNYPGPGIILCLLAMGFVEDVSAQIVGDPLDTVQGIAGVVAPADESAASKRRVTLDSYPLDPETATHWKLPRGLEEVSGLAMTADNRLLAHNDERAIVFEIDYRSGSIVKSFQLSDTKFPVAGDFEGIAATDDRIYLVSSSGRLFEFREGSPGESVLFNVYATGVGRDCEIEGLTYDRSRRGLLLMCKDARRLDMEGKLAIFHWSLDKRQLNEDVRIVIPVERFAGRIKGRKFHPSGIERHPVSGNYFVVAARQGAIAEVTPEGEVLDVRKFQARWHRQVEGITFAADGTLIVADEGAGRKGRLTIYPVTDGAR